MATLPTHRLTIDLVGIAGADIAGIVATVELVPAELVWPVGTPPATAVLYPAPLSGSADRQGRVLFDLVPSSVAGGRYRVTVGAYVREVLMPDRDVRLSEL